MQANVMDRGSEALKTHLSDDCEKLVMKQTRRGCVRECLGCEAKTEFKYYVGKEQVAHSLEEGSCCCRIFCGPIHPYKMVVKDKNTKEELLTVKRPLVCCAPVGPWKCCCPCCYQKAFVTSEGNKLGRLKENCWMCVPSFNVYDHKDKNLFLIKPPTCCFGTVVNCCAEGNPCGRGCCKSSFRVYKPGKAGMHDPHLGVILRKPKSLFDEFFTDADTFDVSFPKDATADQKGLLTGVAIYINSVFYEDWKNEEEDV